MTTRQRRRSYFIFFFVLSTATSLMITAATFLPASLYAVSALPQQQERLIKRLSLEKDEPIVILQMRVRDRPVFSGEKFAADDDWLKHLVITVSNVSNQRILFISIRLQFPRPPGSQEKLSISDIPYGNRALETRPPTEAERLVGLAPGQTADMQLTAKRFDDMRQFLMATGYGTSIDRVHLNLNSVIFEDDTMWNSGDIFHRDQNEAGRWNPPPRSSRKESPKSFVATRSSTQMSSNHTFQIFRMNQFIEGGLWSFRHRSDPRMKRLFSHPSSAFVLPPPQTVCFDKGVTLRLQCGVPGHTCTYEKDTLLSDAGGYYLADGSIQCTDSGWSLTETGTEG